MNKSHLVRHCFPARLFSPAEITLLLHALPCCRAVWAALVALQVPTPQFFHHKMGKRKDTLFWTDDKHCLCYHPAYEKLSRTSLVKLSIFSSKEQKLITSAIKALDSMIALLSLKKHNT